MHQLISDRLISVVILIGLLWGFLRYFEWKNLYYPRREIEATPKDMGLEFEEIFFVAEDGCNLHGWWIPHEESRGTIIHCHGNAGNLGDRAWLAADLHRLGVNVFMFDYRGYGRSKGIPSEKGTYRDARAAYEVVRARYEDSNNPPVIVHGQSLGGSVAIQLAMDKPVKGLIVESVFSSIRDMAEEIYPMLPIKWVCRYKYDSVSKVGQLRMPKLFAHSRADELVPYALGKKIFDAAAEPKVFVELSGDHNNAGWSLSPGYWLAMENLVNRVFGPR